MNLFEAGVLPGIPIGGIVGGILCKSFGTLATVGGVITGLFIGGFVGWLYAGIIIFLISFLSVLWNAVAKHPNLETTEEEYLIINRTARLAISIALIGSTIVSFKEVWYNGLILAAILAVFIAFIAVIAGKSLTVKNNVLHFKFFDLEKIEDTNKLIRYRWLMLFVVQLCIFTSIAVVSGTALGLAFGFHTAEIIILLISCAISLTTFVPSAFFFAWIDEIEKILAKRNVIFDRPISKRIQTWALKMMFWAVLVVLLPMLIRKLTGAQP